MPKRARNKSDKEVRVNYRTSIVRAHKLHQRKLDLNKGRAAYLVGIEDIVDFSVDRYFKDRKTIKLEEPQTILEADYCRRMLKILRNQKQQDAACHKEMLDMILRNYE